MYSNIIFPITDLPRGLGLNIFSRVLLEHTLDKNGST